jgi:hypothetical protein
MTRLKTGDRVECCIQSNTIVAPDEDHETTRFFEIVSTDNYGYYLFIPYYMYINGTTIADLARCQKLGIHPRFGNEKIIYITDNLVHKTRKSDGMCCMHCKDFTLMAEANQPDGTTFICWSCRDNPWR